jgi:hypothetical protein
VIAGIVFEDTVRRICRTLDISEKGVALETLITDLAKRDVLTALKAKRVRAAAAHLSGARQVGRVRDWRREPGDRVHEGTYRGAPRIALSRRPALKASAPSRAGGPARRRCGIGPRDQFAAGRVTLAELEP